MWLFKRALARKWELESAAQQEHVALAWETRQAARHLTSVEAERMLRRERSEHEETLKYVTEELKKAECSLQTPSEELPPQTVDLASPGAVPNRQGRRMGP